MMQSIGVGESFRVAHPHQKSMNGLLMPREAIFVVKRIYEMAPYLTISNKKGDATTIYSLGPRTPVLFPKEKDPTEEEVFIFLGIRSRKQVLYYKLLWDGRSDIGKLLAPQAAALLRLMYSYGHAEFPARELHRLMNDKFDDFFGRPAKVSGSGVFKAYRRHLVARGFLEEVVDKAPVPRSVVEANLQEEW